MSETNQKTRFRIEGMDCAACTAKIDRVVRHTTGVTDVNVSATAGTMVVDHEAGADLAGMAKRVAGLGYGITEASKTRSSDTRVMVGPTDLSDRDIPSVDYGQDEAESKPSSVAGLHGHDHAPGDGPWWESPKARLTIACGAALGAAFVLAQFYPATDPWIFIAAMAVGLIPIARRSVMAALNGIPFTIETLMTVAAVKELADVRSVSTPFP